MAFFRLCERASRQALLSNHPNHNILGLDGWTECREKLKCIQKSVEACFAGKPNLIN